VSEEGGARERAPGGVGSPAGLGDDTLTTEVPALLDGVRVDRGVAMVANVSRAAAARLIGQERVLVDGEPVRVGRETLRPGTTLTVRLAAGGGERVAAAEPSVRFTVVHADEAVAVVDKPAGLVVHPGAGHDQGTLVGGLLARFPDLAELVRAGVCPPDRPGIVHRLDKGTSGVMVVARTPRAREALKAQFQAHSIERAYEAIVVGRAEARTFSTLHGRHPRDRLRFTSRVARGKQAVTHVRVLGALWGAAHVACTLETGRTHQIRVHLSESGTPVLADPLYGKPPRAPELRALAERLGHQALHARVLGFVHPVTGQTLRFEAPPPADFREALEALR
jgi:23S rRNA pseudouridine1911/1915/1917 synthase